MTLESGLADRVGTQAGSVLPVLSPLSSILCESCTARRSLLRLMALLRFSLLFIPCGPSCSLGGFFV